MTSPIVDALVANEPAGADAVAAVDAAPSSLPLEVLRDLEFSGRDNASPACPYCKAQPPLDPANPRNWERHAPACKLAAAIASLS